MYLPLHFEKNDPGALGELMVAHPPGYTAAMLRAIVGVEIPIDRLVGKFKLSQNRESRDRLGVLQGGLSAGHDNARAMASWMQREP